MNESFRPTLDALQDRVERLEAEREILRLIHSYGPCLDYGDDAAWVQLFVEDGMWEVIVPGHETRRFEGHSELRTFAAQHTNAPGQIHKHCVYDPLVTFINSDEVAVISYYTRLDVGPSGPMIRSMGRYHDQLVRLDDGQWRFRRRTAEIEAYSQPPIIRVNAD